jgi:alginate O-acetyltransferase complex protein AlgI
MEFNSWQFVLFFMAVVAIYRVTPSRLQKNIVLLITSYAFYSAWDWRFCGLILVSTLVDFLVGKKIHASASQANRKRWLFLSLSVNLGILGFFKYFNFFVGSFVSVLHDIGLNADATYFNIILPIGISFYTFQTMSYTIDIYRNKLKPTSSLIDFAVFVAFFPQLIAGPIERAANILPQLKADHVVSKRHLWIGLQLILWGLFKKVYVADNVAIIVDRLFDDSANLPIGLVYLASFGFAVQIYADFSAYSDIARGCAKVFGIDLMRNFRNPYIASNPQDFWGRWHISLSTWLRDYLYIPLGGNRRTEFFTYRNLILTMVLGGLWHGAAWNYVLWGIYHGSILVLYRYVKNTFSFQIPRLFSILIMFHFTLFGWLLFRSTRTVIVDGARVDESFMQIGELLGAWTRGFMFDGVFMSTAYQLLLFSVPLFLPEILNARHRLWHPLYFGSRMRSICVVSLMLFLVVRYGVQNANSFIYFQF